MVENRVPTRHPLAVDLSSVAFVLVEKACMDVCDVFWADGR